MNFILKHFPFFLSLSYFCVIYPIRGTPTKRPPTKGPGTKVPATKCPGYESSGNERSGKIKAARRGPGHKKTLNPAH
jgi:hypothetical protein